MIPEFAPDGNLPPGVHLVLGTQSVIERDNTMASQVARWTANCFGLAKRRLSDGAWTKLRLLQT